MNGHQEVVERGVLVFVMERSANFPKQVGWSLDLELGAVGQSCRLGVIYNFLGFLCPRGCKVRSEFSEMDPLARSFLNCHQHHQLTVFICQNTRCLASWQ